LGIARGSGLRIYYELVGTGRPLVLLHGSMGSTDSWRMAGYTERLADRFQLVLVDLRGHGRSERPTGAKAYVTPALAADVVAVLDDLEVDSAPLFGWSRGGETALATAALHPGRAEALILVGTRADLVGFDDVPRPSASQARSLATRLSRSGTSFLEAELQEAGRHDWAKAIGRSDSKAMASLVRAQTLVKSIGRKLHDLPQPILAIWGEDERPDPLPPLPEDSRTVIVPGDDHFGTFSRADVIVPEVRAFLAEH
jgi:pimeloyl-ACP methyl ester carboxylesterase